MNAPATFGGASGAAGGDLAGLFPTPSVASLGAPGNNNWIVPAGAATGVAPTLTATGGDTNIGLSIIPKGTGSILLAGPANVNGALNAGYSLANYTNMIGGAAGTGPTIAALGSDTNINLNLAAKGSGAISCGGYTLTAGNVSVGGGTVSANIFSSGGNGMTLNNSTGTPFYFNFQSNTRMSIGAVNGGVAITSTLTAQYQVCLSSQILTATATLGTSPVFNRIKQTAAGTYTLPAAPTNATILIIKDASGNFNTYNATITAGTGDTIEGAATYVMNQARQAIWIEYDSTNKNWNIV